MALSQRSFVWTYSQLRTKLFLGICASILLCRFPTLHCSLAFAAERIANERAATNQQAIVQVMSLYPQEYLEPVKVRSRRSRLPREFGFHVIILHA